MQKKKPVISVLMTVYKDRDYLAEAVQSILCQSYKNFEFLIIAEPEMPKESLEIIQSFQDKRIRLIINKKHLGFSDSLNKGIRMARGKYIARMDADDISLPGRLLFQYIYLQTHPHIIMCGTNAISVNSKGKELDRTHLPASKTEIKIWLHFANVIYHPTVMYRRKDFLLHNFFYKVQQAEDYELWSRVVLTHGIANLRSVQLKRRLHGSNSIRKNRQEIQKSDLKTQKELWKKSGILIDISRPFYDTDRVKSGERRKRKQYIEQLENKIPFWCGKYKVFREIRHAFIDHCTGL